MENVNIEKPVPTYGQIVQRAIDTLPADKQVIIVAHIQGVMSGILYNTEKKSA